MIKTVKVEDAIGLKLAHDITEIRPGEFKGAAFHKDHKVCSEDICRLQRLGKNHLYVIELEADEIHENEAAAIMAGALAGEGIVWEDNPQEGKINLYAARDGLLTVNVTTLAAFNLVDEVMCATLHNHTLVRQGEKVAATRAIPLIMKRAAIERAAAIARSQGAVVARQGPGPHRRGDHHHRQRSLSWSHRRPVCSHTVQESRCSGFRNGGFRFCPG